MPAAAAEFRVSLKAAEDGALARSGQYRAARLEAGAARAAQAAASSLLYPRLSLEGSLRYTAVIPEIALPKAMGGARPLGDNWGYSIGPTAYWTLDAGALRYGREAAGRLAAARTEEEEAARRQALLSGRSSYFRLQLALEKVYLIAENLQLSLSQLSDVEAGVKAGTRSRLDGLRARQEVTDRRRDLLRARAALADVVKEFAFVTGIEPPAGAGLPIDSRMAGRDYAGDTFAGLIVGAESYLDILPRLLPAAGRGPDASQPAVRALEERGKAFRAAAGAYKAEKLPRLTLTARSSIDYPNGPNLYSFLQNYAGLSLSVPLFEKGRLGEREKESLLSAQAAGERREEAARAAAREYDTALDDYSALMEEQSINIDAVDDASAAAKLAYEAYKAGSLTWLEVESANLKELQAKTTAASANAEILLKLALLDSLSGSVN
ncbi:MAG: TolC family protein [Elusimicrobia bacterium]|nr:TolC family protein [Elusimicrobiota bacterium]